MSYLAHIGNTVFGMYQMKYNKAWDEKLNQLLDSHSQEAKLGSHTITLGVWDVWTSNKWFAYGNAWRLNDRPLSSGLEFRPSIKTMRRLDKLVQEIKRRQKEAEQLKSEAMIAELFSLEAVK